MATLEPAVLPAEEARLRGSEAAIYAARARSLGLPFAPVIPGSVFVAADAAAAREGRVAMSAEAARLTYVAPDEAGVADGVRWLRGHPFARRRLAVSTPTAIRAALRRAIAVREASAAAWRLAEEWPEFSARRVFTLRQAILAAALSAGIAVAAAAAGEATLAAIDAVGAFFFLGVSAMRFVAAYFLGRQLRRNGGRFTVRRLPDERLPVYTLLVPLYREAAVVGDLVDALDLLDWPRDRLDIKLLLEADDRETIAAARAAAHGPPYELVLVPPVGPRTKPKALAYALGFARGELLTVYDAEDRPHPWQLRAAHARFAAAGPELGCIQATLAIDNASDSWLALSFAVEYAALFDGLLPALARLGLPLPLGGTSNHFRVRSLKAVGAWDPFNVTEDADLGVRLARLGYRTETLPLPTAEEAPARLMPWLRQRTRWFKGWMQTWLVHTRHPWRLARDLGWRRFIAFNLICTGIVVSSIIYPLYLLSLASVLLHPGDLFGDHGPLAAALKGINVFNLCAGYLAMVLLAGRALRLRGRDADVRGLFYLPVYWFLMSVASYRALWQLVSRPHHWEKTAHRRRNGGFRRVPRGE